MGKTGPGRLIRDGVGRRKEKSGSDMAGNGQRLYDACCDNDVDAVRQVLPLVTEQELNEYYILVSDTITSLSLFSSILTGDSSLKG